MARSECKMRKLFLLLLCVFFATSSHIACAGVHEALPYNFVISKYVSTFEETYQINPTDKSTYVGSIKNSALRIGTHYDLSNKDGWQATGIVRIISLGSLYPWAKDIDIYDTRKVQIGMIDGSITTLESAKFDIYNYDDAGKATQTGIAYANPDFTRFVIMSFPNTHHPIAEMYRDFNDGTWHVSVHYPEAIDDRIMRIFAGFVIDYQDKFVAASED